MNDILMMDQARIIVEAAQWNIGSEAIEEIVAGFTDDAVIRFADVPETVG
jgi:hypothetical protein